MNMELVRRHAERLLECAGEVVWTQPDEAGEGRNRDLLREMLLDMRCDDSLLPLLRARLSRDFKQKTGLTRFLPARLSEDGSTVEPLNWQGSGDIPAIARANAFLVTEPERETWKEGDDIRVLLK